MTTMLTDITRYDNGARFYTADLHIHSYGASADVSDSSMTVEAIIEDAVKENLALISITDHNTDRHVQESLEYGAKYSGRLLVLPGVEVTTANGHLLVYFPPERPELVGMLLGRIGLQGTPGARDSHTTGSMADVIRDAERLGGLCVAAHIDRAKMGFEMMIQGYPNAKRDIIASSGLFGLEFDNSEHLNWYTYDDEPTPEGAARKQILSARQTSSATAARLNLAAVQNSDAHSLNDFRGQHAKRSLSKIKMTSLGFEGFRTGFTDPEARVRAITTIPPSTPRLIGLQVNGGFLDGSVFHLSPNLNCLIGGRGAGKSTAVKSIAHALGLSDLLESQDNCPDSVVLYCIDSNGVYYRYERIRGNELRVLAVEDRDKGPIEAPIDAFRVEYYGQGDLAEVSRNLLENPRLLQEFLDRHIVLSDLTLRATALMQELEENSAQLIPVEASAAQLRTKEEEIGKVNQKLQIAEEGRVRDIAALQSRLAAEKTLAEQVSGIRTFYVRGMSLAKFLRDFGQLIVTAGTLTGRTECQPALDKMRATIDRTNQFLQQTETTINTRLKQFALELDKALSELKEQHVRFDEEIASKTTDLQKKGLSGSLKELTDLIGQRTALSRDIARIKDQQPLLNQLRDKRRELIQGLSDVRAQAEARRKKQLGVINRNLRITIDDYAVNLYYDEKGICDAFESLMSDVMHGSYFSDEAIAEVCNKTAPAELAGLIHAKNVPAVAKYCGVNNQWAEEIARRFGILAQLHKLEVTHKPARPVIKVITRGGSPKQIPVNQLSDGQKHTILLTIAMLAESNLPLIMDQPEDDLDNAFIFKSVVTTLRSIKERRQVILVTHNANIAVLGDSELILPMRRASDIGTVFDRGAIDHPSTRTAVQQVLEGGELAFQRRKAIYGY